MKALIYIKRGKVDTRKSTLSMVFKTVSNFTLLTSSSIISSIFSSFNYCGIIAADENVKHSSDVVYSLMTVCGSNSIPDYHGRVYLLRKVLTRGDRKP